MSVFALWADFFYKYIFVLMEYGVFYKNVFSEFYENGSTCKYMFKNVPVKISIHMLQYLFTLINRLNYHLIVIF